jgi:hypothetical protein
MIIDSTGRRFANEAESYHEFVKIMHARDIKRTYLIADRNFLRTYGMGMALPWPYHNWNRLRQGYLFSAPSISSLAAKIGVPADALTETIVEVNDMAKTGVDLQFHKGVTSCDQFYGEHSKDLKNPNLGSCSQGPFYALPIYPGNVSTLHGLPTNAEAQVLDKAGKPIAGPYVVGCDQNHVFRGYPGVTRALGPGWHFIGAMDMVSRSTHASG